MELMNVIELSLKKVGWEIISAFDAIYRFGPTGGVYNFKSTDSQEFNAIAGQTPHFVCIVGVDDPQVNHAWFDPESGRFCFHEGPKAGQDLDDTIQVKIFNRAAGFAYAQAIAQNPQRTRFAELRNAPVSGPALGGGL